MTELLDLAAKNGNAFLGALTGSLVAGLFNRARLKRLLRPFSRRTEVDARLRQVEAAVGLTSPPRTKSLEMLAIKE